MRVFKSIIFSGILTIAMIGMASCEKKQDTSENDPQLEVFSKTIELPDAPKDTAPETGDGAQSQAPAVSQAVVNSSIVGVWVLSGESCDSSNGIIFDTGGKYAADGEEGNWKTNGNEIAIKLAAASSDTNEELRIKVLTLGADSAILQRPDGSNVEWKRCPAVPNLTAKKSEELAK